MTQQRPSSPSEILAAAQAAVEAAQAVARSSFDTAVRLPPASAQLAAQMPDLIENLANAIERLNRTLDRVDRMLTMMDSTISVVDRLIPRLEDVARVGEELRKLTRVIPGIGVLTRLAGISDEEAEQIAKDAGRDKSAKGGRTKPAKDAERAKRTRR